MCVSFFLSRKQSWRSRLFLCLHLWSRKKSWEHEAKTNWIFTFVRDFFGEPANFSYIFFRFLSHTRHHRVCLLFCQKKRLRCYTRYTPARLIMTWTGERANFLFSCSCSRRVLEHNSHFLRLICFSAFDLHSLHSTQHFNGYPSRVNRSPTKMNRWTVTQDFSISFHRTFLYLVVVMIHAEYTYAGWVIRDFFVQRKSIFDVAS